MTQDTSAPTPTLRGTAGPGELERVPVPGSMEAITRAITPRRASLRNKMARVILRAIQEDAGITRTHLMVQVRPYGPECVDVIEALKDRHLIREEAAVLRTRGSHKRAAIVYYLVTDGGFTHPDYNAMDAEEVAQALGLSWAPTAVPSLASHASA